MVMDKHFRARIAVAAQCQRFVNLLADAFEYGIEVRLCAIELEQTHPDPQVDRIVRTVETFDIGPGDLRPILKQPHDDRDAAKRAMRDQGDEAGAGFGRKRRFARSDLRGIDRSQKCTQRGHEFPLDWLESAMRVIPLKPWHADHVARIRPLFSNQAR